MAICRSSHEVGPQIPPRTSVPFLYKERTSARSSTKYPLKTRTVQTTANQHHRVWSLVLDFEGARGAGEGDGGGAADADGLSGLRVATRSRQGLLLLEGSEVAQSELSALVQNVVVDDRNQRVQDKLDVFLLEAGAVLQLGEKVSLSNDLYGQKR